MNFMKFAKPEFTYIFALLLVVFQKQVFNICVGFGLPWSFVYIQLWLVMLLFSVYTAILCWKILKGHTRIWVPILAFVIPLASYFAAAPIYRGDFNKSGVNQDITDNGILADVLTYKPDFDGVVCVASPHCPFCVEAVKDKMNLVFKRNKIDVLVYLAFGDDIMMQDFRKRAEAVTIPIIVNSNPNSGLDIDENVIPVFLFIKNNKIVHLWRNDQLGYPALDWMEGGLK